MSSIKTQEKIDSLTPPKCWACHINEKKKEIQCGVCRRELEIFNIVLLTLNIEGSQCTAINLAGSIVSAFDCIDRNIKDIESLKMAISKDSEIDFYNIIITNPETIPESTSGLSYNNMNNNKTGATETDPAVEIIKGIYKSNKGNIIRETEKMVYVSIIPDNNIVRLRKTSLKFY